MNKKNIIIISSISVILILAIIFTIFLLPNKSEDYSLVLKRGDVNVLLKGSDWIKVTEQENHYDNLEEVKTGDGEAVLTLFKSTIIMVEKDSLVKIKDVVDEDVLIKNENGKTWHKFLGLSGIKNYEVETTHTVASVRGTSFLIENDENSSKFMLAEGELRFNNTDEIIDPLQKITFFNDTFLVENMTEDEIAEILEYSKKTVEEMKNVRYTMINEYSNVVETIKKLTKTTDEDIEQTLIEIDQGIVDDKELVEQSPIPLPDAIDELLEINYKIKEQMTRVIFLEGLNN